MNKPKLILSILAILFGPLLVVYGGIDDSPGGQLIGLAIFIVGIVGVVKSRRRN